MLEVHRRYAGAGCDVISTNTWAILDSVDASPPGGRRGHSMWADAARAAVRLARRAVAEVGRADECVVAFCVNGGLGSPDWLSRLELLSWVWNEEPPDLVLLETLDALPGPVMDEAAAAITGGGLPLWVSFRRSRHGMCDPTGLISTAPRPARLRCGGRPAGGGRGRRPARQLPPRPRHPARRERPGGRHQPADRRLPEPGHQAGHGWEPDAEVGPQEYADLAASWWESGARIIGGCCGVTPAHLRAVRERLADAPALSTPA